MSPTTPSTSNQHMDDPLYVTLKALCPSHLLWELAAQYWSKQPAKTFQLLWWRLQGRQTFIDRILQADVIDCGSLPYHPEAVEVLAQNPGRRVVLVSSSQNQKIAQRIVRHKHALDEVATQIEENPSSGTFDLIAGCETSPKTRRQARHTWFVESPGQQQRGTQKNNTCFLGPSYVKKTGKALLGACRPHQWSKNLLLAIPLITSHSIIEPAQVGRTLGGILMFSFCASAVYIFNDLMDLQSDRQHPHKAQRSLASGKLSIPAGVGLGVGLLAAVVAAGGIWGQEQLLLLLGLYIVLNGLYSPWLKHIPIVDLFVLAAFYVLRVFAGGAVISVSLSPWLLMFSLFLFFGLAGAKRFGEISHVSDARRPYREQDLPFLQAISLGGGYLSVLVLALYIYSPQVSNLYTQPQWLWTLPVLMLFWFTRLWFLVQRQKVQQGPLLFTITDLPSYGVAILGGLSLLLAA